MKGARNRPAKIINVGSAYSKFGGAFVAAYSASKGGVVQLTRSLAVEWAPKNICVNAIVPGWFETEMTAPMRMVPDSLKNIIKRTPMGRLGLPDELAGAAVFLASPASDFITGICLWVDGGYSAA
jgi:2-deoxy-D-gluconate 3-dehydrogenase